jgi:hypothetical protein
MFNSRVTIDGEQESNGANTKVFMTSAGNGRFNRRILTAAVALGVTAGAMVLPAAGASASPGSASAKVTVGSKTYKLSGGACQVTGSKANVGIGGSPNSLGLHATVHKGKFSNAQIGLVLGGKPLAITTDTGTATAKGGTFKGTDVVSQSTVKGTFTC